MRPYQLFAAMKPEQARALLDALKEKAPVAYAQALGLTAGAIKARPVFVQKQPPERRAELMRKALSRVASDPIAEEMLAVYFLECRNEVLVDWLDRIGVEHDKGTLAGEPSEPPAEQLGEAVAGFRKAAGDEADAADRELLLRAFAAQSSIEWPGLEALLPR
ncbi:MAG TPA: hypothetical protein VLC53_06870 [Myxococcota bacterium]|nr:hypothetical protein [Myxococcota bacterium]